jgi:hypothetical protein
MFFSLRLWMCAVFLLNLAGLFVGVVGIARAEDPILEWNAVMIQADAVDHSGTVHQQKGPILASRAFAITSVAMYDALSCTPGIWRVGHSGRQQPGPGA